MKARSFFERLGRCAAAVVSLTAVLCAGGLVHSASAAGAAPTLASIWGSGGSPGASSDPSPIEVGVKFRSDTVGYIHGVRFYKGTGNTGTHKGTLWSKSGGSLASATFTNETASGWQEVRFSAPVAIAANTTYVASCFLPAGHYAATEGFFGAVGADATPLHALKSGVDGGNGVYRYGASAFPNTS
jgi:hypothetical protein